MIDLPPSTLDDVLADLRAWTAIDCGTRNKAGVDAVGALAAARARSMGFDVVRHAMPEFGDCYTAVARGSGQGRLMLMGHLDTVYETGVCASHPWREEAGRIYAPGIADMKGGLLTGLYAMRAFAADRSRFESITFFFNSEEEYGSPASRPLSAERAAGVDAALVYEPARASGDIVSARKASGDFTLAVKGFSTHAGVAPEKGINATVELAHRIVDIASLNGLRPGVTVTPSVVRGGTAVNVVPDSASIGIDCRATDLEGVRAVEAALKAITARTTIPGAVNTLSGGFSFPPMVKTPAVALMAELARDAAQELGFSINDVATGGASDASALSQIVPTIDGMGPVGGNAHNAETEYVERASLLQRIAMSVVLFGKLLAPATLARLRAARPRA